MANKAIKYRLYPTKEQATFFAKTFGCCRKVYNLMLSDKIKSYEETKSFGKQTPAMYKKEYPYLKEVDSLALANVQLHLQAAMKNCFDKTRKIQNGFPKYKSAKHSRKSYTTNNQKGTIAFSEKGIKLPKIGVVKAVIHRKPKEDWNIKSATISMEKDGTFYVSVLFEYDSIAAKVSKTSRNAIGLDYKSDGLYMDSNGNCPKLPKRFRESQEKLRKAQKKLARMITSHIVSYKIKGKKCYPVYDKELSECKNIEKQRMKIAKIHRHIANQRLDDLHKKSTEIANQVDIVCVETLNMKAISNKGFGNGKATLDNGYGLFLNLLEYKLSERGKYFVKIDKWYPSSQICSCCGKQKKLALPERVYECTCGMVMDRDYNAAINIREEGIRLLCEEVA